jgi:hypothetical protein
LVTLGLFWYFVIDKRRLWRAVANLRLVFTAHIGAVPFSSFDGELELFPPLVQAQPRRLPKCVIACWLPLRF